MSDINQTNTVEELANEIKKQDPDFDPDSVGDNPHPWRRVADHTLYPELKPIVRGKTIEYQVLDTPGNLLWLLEQFEASIRYNKMTRRREIVIPNLQIFPDDEDNDTLARVEAIATLNHMPVKNIDKWLNVLSADNTYHPIVESIENTPWDGVPRLATFIDTIQTTRPEIDRLIIKTWMVAAIAAAYTDTGFISHGVLVIQGPQGLGKSSWIKSLGFIPDSVKLSALLIPSCKDSVTQLARFWLVELGELDATFNKSDIARLKSYITNDVDVIRNPWARKDTGLIRRTVYAATVNSPTFLMDNTGNRRWWTIEATKINYEHDFPMQQVWAEVKTLWQGGALTYLPSNLQQIVDDNNAEHEVTDPIKELLLTRYDWSSSNRYERTTSDILGELGRVAPSRSECTRIGTILIEINGEKGRRSNGVTLHKIPPKLYKS